MSNIAQLQIIRNYFWSLSKGEKIEYLQSLTNQERVFFYQHPDIFLFDKQLIPGGDIVENGNWLYYLLRCGRSFGKTFAGSAWVANKIRRGARLIGLCGPTYDDVAKTMVPAILNWFLPHELADPPYNAGNHTIRFTNGAKIYCYTSDKEIRGPNLEYLWCDEICVWSDGIPEKIKERFEDISRAVRVGKHPQIVITSTPKTHPFFIEFQKQIDSGNTNYCMVQGSLLDNPTLPQVYIDEQIKAYGNTSRGRQEVFGDLITDMPGAYWTHEAIDICRSELPAALTYGPRRNQPLTNDQLMGRAPIEVIDKTKPYLIRILIGFDPSGSVNGDECGIVVVALYSNKEAYVLEDCSGSYNPDQYAKLISEKYIKYQAAGVVVETNFGGKETFKYVLRTVNATMNIIPRHNSQGKTTRAEHISSLYSLGRVHHVGSFQTLEDQMCSFNVNYSKSPDRLDALGLAVTELFFPTDASGNRVAITNLPSYQ